MDQIEEEIRKIEEKVNGITFKEKFDELNNMIESLN